MLQSDNNNHSRQLGPDELEKVIGGAGSNEDTRGVSCPVCGCKFSIPEGRTSGKCPDCGATVNRKK